MFDDLIGWFDAETRAVSVVIGIILMVAITVILAAVVGAFMLQFGQDVDEAGPTASLSVEDADENIDTARNQFVVVEHDGGDPIDANTLKITVRYDSNNTPVGTWDDGGWDAKGRDNFDIDDESGYNNGIDYNGRALSTNDILEAGDQLTWYLDDDPGSSTSPGIEASAEYRLTFIDTSSQKIIADVVVRIE